MKDTSSLLLPLRTKCFKIACHACFGRSWDWITGKERSYNYGAADDVEKPPIIVTKRGSHLHWD